MPAEPAADPQPGPRPPRRRWRIAGRSWAVAGAVVVLLVLGGATAVHASGGWLLLGARSVGLVASLWQPKVVEGHGGGSGTSAVKPAAVRPEEPFSILVLGTEQAPSYAAPQLTDSIMVLSYDPVGQTVALLSIPRDLWVDIPGVGKDRINVAYEDGGVALAKLAVEQVVDLPIQYYAVVNYQAFVDLVNDVGGIDVDVPQNISDPNFPNAAEDASTLFQLSAGPHHLDGATALQYIRERHVLPQGDISREQDQQQVLLALKAALLQPANLLHVGKILGDVFGAVQTDVPYSSAATLAARVLQLPSGAMHTAVFDLTSGAVSNWVTPGGAEVLLPDDAVIHQIVAANFAPLLAPMAQYTVEVENGTPSTDQLDVQFATLLQAIGAQATAGGAADSTAYRQSAVVLNTAVLPLTSADPSPVEADMLARMLGTNVDRASITASPAQIVVTLGATYPGG